MQYSTNTCPTHTGGTRVLSSGTIQYNFAQTAATNATLFFGNATDGISPGTITLDGGNFDLVPTLVSGGGLITLTSPIVVTTNNGGLYGDPKATTLTNIFAGPVLLGGRLIIGKNALNGGYSYNRCQGTVTIDQSSSGPRALSFSFWQTTPTFEGGTADGTGTARNCLMLDAGITLALTNGAYAHANGTFIEGDTAGLLDVKPANSSSLGLGDIWLPEGARMRLAQLSNVASGAKVGLWANQSASSLLVVTTNFVPALRSDAAGVLAADCANFNAVTNMALLGGGQMFLGSYAGGTFVGTTLSPASDGIYRLGAGGNTLTINNGVLTGATCSAQVGKPGIGLNGSGTVILKSANTYGGGNVIHKSSTLEGTAQASGTPFGSSTAGLTINGGTLRLDGIATANVTNNVGAVTVNGTATFTMNQANAQTNGLVINSLPTRNQATPYIVNLSGSALASLGVKERIVLASGAPTPANGMVSPIYGYSTGDFVTYNSGSDSSGPIGFQSAAGSYVAVNNAATLAGVGANGIASVTGAITITNNANVSVYAMKINGNLYNDSTVHTITIGSGGLFVYSTGCTTSNNINFGSSEGILNCAGPLNVYAQLIGTNGVTKSGAGTLALNTDSSTSFTGTVSVLQGILWLWQEAALGAAGNGLYIDGGSMETHGSAITTSRPIVLGPSGATVSGPDANTGAGWTFNGPITGPGMLYAGGGNAVLLNMNNANNTYAGGTILFSQINLKVATNSSLGVGDVTADYNLFLYGDHNIGGGDYYGANTTNRLARLSIMDGGVVNFYSLAPTIASLSGSGSITLTNNCVLTVGGDNSSTIYAGIISQSTGSGGSLYKTGSGTFRFKGRNVCTGTTTVQQGEFATDGFMAGGITVNSGATLSGAGNVGPVAINSGATLQTGSTNTSRVMTLAGALTLASGSTLIVNLNGTNQFDQIAASGAVSLSGATLQVNLNYAPSAADTFQIVTSPVSITGTFVGLPNNSLIHFANNYVGRITYSANAVTISNITKGLYGSVIMFE